LSACGPRGTFTPPADLISPAGPDSPMPPVPPASVTLLECGCLLFQANRHQAAYHALLAAVYAARDESDAPQLTAVSIELRNCQRALDALHPTDPLATVPAESGRGPFALAADIAATLARGLTHFRPDAG
jgi:hypothetical protein